MKDGKIAWGVIGFGNIGPHHAKGVTNAPSATLAAICDIDPKREEAARKAGCTAPFYTSMQAMFKNHPELDAVSVCTYSGIHHEAAVAAAKRGLHVLSEKPLDVTLAHMDRMIEACEKAKVKLGCIFQRRTTQDSILAKKAMDKKLLGKMVLGDCYQKYYRSPAYYKSAGWRGTWKLDGGGALMNQGVHGLDQLLWLMGDVESVFSYSATLVRDIEVEDTSVAVVRFKNGAFGNLVTTTSVVPSQGARVSLHGEKGSITIGDGPMKCQIGRLVKGVHQVEEVDLAAKFKMKSVAPKTTGNVSSDAKAVTSDGHTIQIEDMCQAILKDRQPMVPGREARKAVELILAIYKSWKTGKEVKLPLK